MSHEPGVAQSNPDGINGDHGADISGVFTAQSARDLAILLRHGSLPVILTATG